MKTKKNFQFILAFGDIILMYVSLFLILAFRYHDYSLFPGPQTRQFVLHFSIIHAIWLVLLFSFDFYEVFSIKKVINFFKNLLLFAVLAMASGAFYFYLNLSSLIAPKTILILDVLLFLFFVFFWRLLFNSLVNSKRLSKKIAVVGWRPEIEELVSGHFLKNNFQISALFEPDALPCFGKAEIFSNPSDFLRKITTDKTDLIIFASRPENRNLLLGNVFSDLALKTEIIGLEKFYEETTGKIPLSFIDEEWIVENISKSDKRNYLLVKVIFDYILSFVGLAATVIIFPIIYLAIRIDSAGPIFYIQERRGKGGEFFKLYKFRTMKATDDQFSVWRVHNEDQITRTGRILKKFHIDEFPQFYNILKGDLSFVGPRPEWEKLAIEYEKEIPFYRYRYLVRPGFTGWAQINYPPSSSLGEAREKFAYDLYYIKNSSFLMDVAIILKTIQLFFR